MEFAFREAEDARLLDIALDEAIQGLDETNYKHRVREVTRLVGDQAEGDLFTHRFWFERLGAKLTQALQRDEEAAEGLMIGEVLDATLFDSLRAHRREVLAATRGGLSAEDELARLTEMESWVEAILPAEVIEPLVNSPQPVFRRLAIDYFSATDPERFARLFRDRHGIESQAWVLKEMFDSLYVLRGQHTFEATFWSARVLDRGEPFAELHLEARPMFLELFLEQADAAQAIALWEGEIRWLWLRAEMVRLLAERPDDGHDLSAPQWEPLRRIVLDLYSAAPGQDVSSEFMRVMVRLGGEEVKAALRDTVRLDPNLDRVGGALVALGELKDARLAELLALRVEELSARQDDYYELLERLGRVQQLEALTPALIASIRSHDPALRLPKKLTKALVSSMDDDPRHEVPEPLRAQMERDLEAALESETTSCHALLEKVFLLNFSGDKMSSKRLARIEAHASCVDLPASHQVRLTFLDNMDAMVRQFKNMPTPQLLAFVREHRDSPYRPIRLAVISFEEALAQRAERQ